MTKALKTCKLLTASAIATGCAISSVYALDTNQLTSAELQKRFPGRVLTFVTGRSTISFCREGKAHINANGTPSDGNWQIVDDTIRWSSGNIQKFYKIEHRNTLLLIDGIGNKLEIRIGSSSGC